MGGASVNVLHGILFLLAIEVAQDLRKYILEIYDDHLSSDGLVGRPVVENSHCSHS